MAVSAKAPVPSTAALRKTIAELEAKLQLARSTWREQNSRIRHLERMAAVVEQVITDDDRKKCAALWNAGTRKDAA